MKKTTFGILFLALMTGGVCAATINWGTPVDVSAASDVITEGTLVEAVNAGSTSLGSLTVNGVTFTSDDSFLPNGAVTARYSGDTGDANYNTILDSLDWTSNGAKVSWALGGGNLVSGVEYKIQVWYADTQKAHRNLIYGDGEAAENTVTLSATGQYAIGTFIADGTTQTLTSDGLNDTFNPHLTAYQIRELTTIPTAALTTATNSVSAPFIVDIHFTEAVTGLEESDFSVTNGSIASSSLTGSGDSYSVDSLVVDAFGNALGARTRAVSDRQNLFFDDLIGLHPPPRLRRASRCPSSSWARFTRRALSRSQDREQTQVETP